MLNWTKDFGDIPEYPFARVSRLCRELEAHGRSIINARIGIPDAEAFPTLKERMIKYLGQDRSTYGYPCDVYPERGIPELIDAIKEHYRTVHKTIVEEKNIAVVSWTKDVLHNLPRLFSKSTIVIPDPVYPTYAAAAILAGHSVTYIPSIEEHAWKPELDALSNVRNPIVFFCDPNNPTGSVADRKFYDRLHEKLDESDGALVADKAYKDYVFDGETRPLSVTEIPGLMDRGFEVVSFSKHYNLVGVGLGWIVGSGENIDRWLRHSSYRSQGVEWYKQMAGADALLDSTIQEERTAYMGELRERRDLFVDGLNGLGLRCEKPKATPYLWIKVPEGYNDEDFVIETLINKAGVAFMPGSYFGECGRGYCRATLYLGKNKIAEALERIERFSDW